MFFNYLYFLFIRFSHCHGRRTKNLLILDTSNKINGHIENYFLSPETIYLKVSSSTIFFLICPLIPLCSSLSGYCKAVSFSTPTRTYILSRLTLFFTLHPQKQERKIPYHRIFPSSILLSSLNMPVCRPRKDSYPRCQ